MRFLEFIRHLLCSHAWSYHRLVPGGTGPIVEVICLKCGAKDQSSGMLR